MIIAAERLFLSVNAVLKNFEDNLDLILFLNHKFAEKSWTVIFVFIAYRLILADDYVKFTNEHNNTLQSIYINNKNTLYS